MTVRKCPVLTANGQKIEDQILVYSYQSDRKIQTIYNKPQFIIYRLTFLSLFRLLEIETVVNKDGLKCFD